jgi:hypothetical protein
VLPPEYGPYFASAGAVVLAKRLSLKFIAMFYGIPFFFLLSNSIYPENIYPKNKFEIKQRTNDYEINAVPILVTLFEG